MVIKARSQEEFDRAGIVDANFTRSVSNETFPKPTSDLLPSQVDLSPKQFLDLFESQLMSRHLDLIARQLKKEGKGYYTIGSSGHEGNAAIALAFRQEDIALLHYRSGAFFIQRAKTLTDSNPSRDILLSLLAAEEDPISGGRHKVLGSLPLFIPPQTSTIASHLPKAVGLAGSIKRAHLLKLDTPLPSDSVVLCSFGDASVNHSTALGALNTAQWVMHRGYPLPIVFICEDNGLGVSVETPEDWIESTLSMRPHIEYIQASGLHLPEVYYAASQAERIARVERRPVFLHLKLVRLLGHAGSDFELQYRSLEDVEANEANDPLLHSARLILEQGYLSKQDILDQYEKIRQDLNQELSSIQDYPQLDSAEKIKSSIVPPSKGIALPPIPKESLRESTFGDKYKKLHSRSNLCQQINYTLTDLLLQYPNVIIFGEDVAKKGGVYTVTSDLMTQFRRARVFDSLLDEQSILGYAIGHAQNGFIPIPEVQFLGFFHNAEDQLRGEAATLSFFSKGQFTNPMVIRIPSFAYQKGFGGHFHNENSIAGLRDIPGLIIACPSNGPDAAKMLRECVAQAHQAQRISVFLEPIALYMERDLHTAGDQQWLFDYPKPDERIVLGEFAAYGDSEEMAIVTYGNGHYLSQQAAKIVSEEDKLPIKIIDLRWLHPLNETALLKELSKTRRILIVDECRKTGSLSEQLMALFAEHLEKSVQIERLTGEDSFIPLGNSWKYVLPSKEDIVKKLRNLFQ